MCVCVCACARVCACVCVFVWKSELDCARECVFMTEEVLACPLINAVFTCILLPLSLFFSSLFCLHKVILYVCFFFCFFQDYRCPCARFPAILDSSKDVFFLVGTRPWSEYYLQWILWQWWVLVWMKTHRRKVIAQICRNHPMCSDSFTIKKRSYLLSENLQNILSVNQQIFLLVTLPSNEGCSQFSLCLFVTLNLEWSDRNQEAKTVKHKPQCMQLSSLINSIEPH